MTVAVVAYVIAVIFVATLIRSALGFGEALIAVPLLAIRIPVTVAAPLVVLISVVVAAGVVFQDWQKVELRSASGLILSSLPGIPIGIFLLLHGDERVVKSVLGLLIAGYAVYSLASRTRHTLSTDNHTLLAGCGFLSGVMGGAYGMNGPPLAVYGRLRGWSPQHFRATLQAYFLPASLIGLLGYWAAGLWSAVVTQYFLLSLPGVGAAILLGRGINQRMNGQGFLRIICLGLLAIGTGLIIQALAR